MVELIDLVNCCNFSISNDLTQMVNFPVSVSIAFPSNSQRDAPFHHIAYDNSLADGDGLCDH